MQKRIVKLKQEGDYILWQTYPKKDEWDFIKRYFRVDTDYEDIMKNILKDEFVKKSVIKFPDIRLLKQDFEEALISYMISPTNSVKSIRTRVRNLSRKFGEKVILDGHTFFMFPKTEVIADASLNDLLNCSLGFRAGRIKTAAGIVLENNLTKKITNYSEEKSRDELMKLSGIGDKVADCILLYSLAYDKIIPVDRWVQRFLINYYNLPSKSSYETMRKWIRDYWGDYAGWAGQYLFEYVRLYGFN